MVTLNKKGELVKVHTRTHRGGRMTDPADYPPKKTTYALRSTDGVVCRASALGPHVEAFARKLFEGPLPWAKLRQGQKLIALGEKYSGERLDAACRRALDYDLVDVRRVQRTLVQAFDREEVKAALPLTVLGSRFARSASAFDHRQREVLV